MSAKTDPTSSLKAVTKNRKEEAVSFLRRTSSGEVREAFEAYIGSHFRHHDPYIPGDAKTLATAMEQNAAAYPDKTFEALHVLEDGDLVAVFSRVRLSEEAPETGAVHIFRFEGDRIVEMWDIAQQVPDESPNSNGMF